MDTDLLDRLDAIGRSLRDSGHALALIGLGSCGAETARLDRWSDLDFFAIVETGCKARYLDRLDWLAAAHPVAWHFRNTVDGHKALMSDGLFCEFAVLPRVEFGSFSRCLPGRLSEVQTLIWGSKRSSKSDPAQRAFAASDGPSQP